MATKILQIVDKVVATDDTLTKTGVAADAAATGSALSEYLPLSGGTMTGPIDMNNNNVDNIGGLSIIDVDNSHMITIIENSSESQNSVLFQGDLGNVILSGIESPVDEYDAVNKMYLEENYQPIGEYVTEGDLDLSVYLRKSGGTMTGDIDMNGTNINNASMISVNNLTLTEEGNTDNNIILSYAGDRMVQFVDSNDTAGNGVQIIGVADPTEETDVTNKRYVDNAIQSYIDSSILGGEW